MLMTLGIELNHKRRLEVGSIKRGTISLILVIKNGMFVILIGMNMKWTIQIFRKILNGSSGEEKRPIEDCQ